MEQVAQYLVEKGAAVNRKTKSGETPLHLAAMFGRPDLVRFLLVKGADYTLTNFHKLGTETIRHTPRFPFTLISSNPSEGSGCRL